jgi:hypothetical protein
MNANAVLMNILREELHKFFVKKDNRDGLTSLTHLNFGRDVFDLSIHSDKIDNQKADIIKQNLQATYAKSVEALKDIATLDMVETLVKNKGLIASILNEIENLEKLLQDYNYLETGDGEPYSVEFKKNLDFATTEDCKGKTFAEIQNTLRNLV